MNTILGHLHKVHHSFKKGGGDTMETAHQLITSFPNNEILLKYAFQQYMTGLVSKIDKCSRAS